MVVPSMLRSFAAGTLFGARYGDGPPDVLALHGWARTHADFDVVLAGLDAIALDLPGFGASPPPPEAWGAAEYAAAVAPVFDEAFDRPAVVLGHSRGGCIAVELAAAHPDKVHALVLTGVPLLRRPSYGARRPSAGYRMAKALHRAGLVSAARMERLRYERSAPDWRAAEGIMRDVFTRFVNESYADQMRAVQCPVELVWGDRDTAAPIALAEEAAGLIAGAKLHRLAGVGHMTPLEVPDELRAALDRQRP
jgi:pimeloyl-ACP methyl ester carboxylesterase